ncbi:hypothetical protein COCSADRAFT_288018 [Bipolaris sorokiniana ND90Pr]|uniref:Uncharacterized protein n=1 Tax=Cochliobolus sativus (strain ND90Pr / ATCC 201652) TaxID=665912 RepID=M2TEV9_COCSN|nr:uncharacterized protein COCSADRAFT_288018 [Bipolaris sorokiniana ND90Pr]EMD67282.1 hypothetical protein COCSADRAFT_288018 [Bipolaris sorokiniana ND90Pr]
MPVVLGQCAGSANHRCNHTHDTYLIVDAHHQPSQRERGRKRGKSKHPHHPCPYQPFLLPKRRIKGGNSPPIHQQPIFLLLSLPFLSTHAKKNTPRHIPGVSHPSIQPSNPQRTQTPTTPKRKKTGQTRPPKPF